MNLLCKALVGNKATEVASYLNNRLNNNQFRRVNEYDIAIPALDLMNDSQMAVYQLSGLSRQLKWLPLSNEFIVKFGSNHQAQGLKPYEYKVGTYQTPAPAVEQPTTEEAVTV